MFFRTSHVGRCKLLASSMETGSYIQEDVVVYGNDLPSGYSIIDAALNHKDIDTFCMMVERLCISLIVCCVERASI